MVRTQPPCSKFFANCGHRHRGLTAVRSMASTRKLENLSDQAGRREYDRTMTEQAQSSRSRPGLAIAGLLLLAIVGLGPLVLPYRSGPATWVTHYHEGWQEWLAKAIVIAGMTASLLVRVRADL